MSHRPPFLPHYLHLFKSIEMFSRNAISFLRLSARASIGVGGGSRAFVTQSRFRGTMLSAVSANSSLAPPAEAAKDNKVKEEQSVQLRAEQVRRSDGPHIFDASWLLIKLVSFHIS